VTYLEGLLDEMYEESDELWTAIDDIEEDLAYLSDTEEDTEEDSEENVTPLEVVFLLSQYDEDLNQAISDINGLYDQVAAIESKIEETELVNLSDLPPTEVLNIYYNSEVTFNEPQDNLNIELNVLNDEKDYEDGYEGEFEDPDNEIYDETKYGSEKDEVD
jgi:hypothetical protein